MRKASMLGVLLLLLFFVTNLYAADYDLTGTWNYTLSGNWAQGDIGCNPGPAASGTCTITQTDDSFTFAYTSGVVCNPSESCTFSGAVTGSVYSCSTTDIVDDEGGSVTSTTLFTAVSATSASGSGNSVYTHPSSPWTCAWGSAISLTKADLPPHSQYTLTVTTVGSGTVTLNPPGGIYGAGTQVQLTATPGDSEDFSAWSGDLSGTDNPETLTMDSDKSVLATFTSSSSNGDSDGNDDSGSGDAGDDSGSGDQDDGSDSDDAGDDSGGGDGGSGCFVHSFR